MAPNRDDLSGLHGRQAECLALARLVEDTRRGSSSVLVLRGAPGIGKTALLDHAVGLAADLQVTRAAGTDTEMELPYAGLHQLCGSMLGLLGRLPGPQREVLEVVFGMRAGPVPDRLLAGVAVLGLLGEAAAGRPLLCAIEDAHWLDQASGQALAFAARRLPAAPLLVIFTVREPVAVLAGLPELVLTGLRDADARDLLCAAVRWPLDEQVRDQVVTETRGNPRALLELPQSLPPTRLAGGFGLPGVLPDRISDSLLRQLDDLPEQTRLLLLVAAADPTGDPELTWRAAGQLGIPRQAAVPAAEAGLVTFGSRIVFRDLTVRLAAYRSAHPRERRVVHHELAQATDPRAAQDRRAWHRSQAAAEPDEDVAAELDRAAALAQARGGLAASAAFLERAALLTPDAARRPERMLAAAEVMVQAGEPGTAARLLGVAEAGMLDEHVQARACLLRARLAATANRGGEAPRLLLHAAQRMGGSDAAGARTAYLDALGAAIFAARLAPAGGTVADVARAALCAPGADAAGTPDLLDGLAACFGERQSAGTPVLQRALAGFGRGMPAEQELRWLPLASAGALRLWDDQAWEALALRHVRLAREAGALSDLPLALTSLACLRLQAGDLATAESLAAEAQLTASATDGWLFPYGTVSLAAVRGRQAAALALLDSAGQDALLHGEGLGIAAVKWATALLHNGLGQYGKALSAAGEAIWYAGQSAVAGWARTELIEAAARAGQPGRAVEAMRQLAQATTAAGTDWALGIRSRSQALLSDGDLADELYRAAIKHLGQSSAGLDLGRAHLLYGEWLRRESRRVDAREQLRRGNEILGAMGADGFAERARRELLATGETARKRTVQTDRDLTAQELEIAVRARGGMTNTEIGAELFVSPRTVEWHLRKVFVKLGITSRRQLQHALPAAAMCDC